MSDLVRSIAAVSATAILGWGAIAHAEDGLYWAPLDEPSRTPTYNAWVENIVGRYPGQIFNGSSPMPGTTEFSQGRGGKLVGRYEMIEETGPALGTLRDCQAMSDRTLRCTWEDKYGKGLFEAKFAEDFSRFEGFWRTADSPQEFVWTGVRDR